MQEYFISNPYFTSLALTLIHFIWQGCLVALALKVALTITSQKNPQLRYAFASIAMLSCLALPVITFAVIYQPNNIGSSYTSQLIPLLNSASTSLQSNNSYWSTSFIELLPYISVLWLAIVMLLALKLIIEVFTVNQLPKQSVIPADAKLSARFNQLVEKMQLSTTPRLLISLKIDVPMAIGWLKPVILLPASMLSGLTSSQLEMLILHELAHIRRHDYLVNFIQTLVALLLFFHPAVQWVSKQMRNEREYCSDDIAVQYCGDAIAYAHTLADTAAICSKHRHHTIPSMAMAASGGDLKQRVVRLVDHHCTPSNDVGKWLAATTVIISILAFSSQQFLAPGLFDMGAAKQVITATSQQEFINHRNYQQSSLTKTSIARQLLTSEASYPNNITPMTFQLVNQDLNQSMPATNNFNLSSEIRILALEKNTLQPSAIEQQLDTTNSNTDLNSLFTVNQSNTIENNIALSDIPAERPAIQSINLQANAAISNKQENEVNSLLEEQVVDSLALESIDANINSSALNNPYSDQIAKLNSSINSSLKDNELIDNISILDEQVIESEFSLLDQLQSSSSTNEPFIATNNIVDLSLLAQYEQTPAALNNTAALLPNILPIQEFNQEFSQEKAKLIRGIDPKYPANAKRKGLELEVHVHFIIDKSGRIKNIEFEQQNKVSYFRSAIKTAMRKWSFRPAKVDGQPVESKMSKIFSFSLTG